MMTDQSGTEFQHHIIDTPVHYKFNSNAYLRLLARHEKAVRKFFQQNAKDQAKELFQKLVRQFAKHKPQQDGHDSGSHRQTIQTGAANLLVAYLKTTDDIQGTDECLQSSFHLAWRQSLLERTWQRLESFQENSGKRFYTVLRTRIDQPSLSNDQLYEILMESGEAVCGPSAFRECLQKARTAFAKILYDEVLETLVRPDGEKVNSELQTLGLHHFFPSGTNPST